MSLNLNPPFDLKDTPTGQIAVFHGTDVNVFDFIDWIFKKRKMAGEFIELNPQLTRQHIRDYMFSASEQ